MRASWLLRTVDAVICAGGENVRAPSREYDTSTGECELPLNSTHVTYSVP